jgi:phage terminase large subunit-like protein
MTMRKGKTPRIVVTTTPRPLAFLKEIKARSTTVVTRGSTYDNIDHLSQVFINEIIKPYEGTIQGKQELLAEDVEDMPGALWNRALIEQTRVIKAPELSRIVTGIDPSAGEGDGDEAGVITAGVGLCNCKGTPELHGFVLSDASVQAAPERWAAAAVTDYHKFNGDALVAEQNNGGAMVRVTIQTIPHAPPVKLVWASRGKLTRAEPISMLQQQGKIHFVGSFSRLEDELCSWVPGMRSPNRLDAFVWTMTELLVSGADMQKAMDAYRRRAAEREAQS